MNRKVLNKVLIAIMLVIWFFVFKNIATTFLNKEEEAISPINQTQITSFKPITKDTFKLIHLERDPFVLNKRTVNRNTNNEVGVKKSNTKPIVKTVKTKEKNTSWPKISYYGFVKSSNKKYRLALLKINNKLIRVRANTTIDEKLHIVSIYKDSITVKKNSVFKIITREK